MKSNYKFVVLISFFLLILSLGSSISYYVMSLKTTENQLKLHSLPLSVDNIYTDIQKHIIEPYLVASMMANDTFMKDWLVNEEDNSAKIQKYLDSIKNKYGMLTTFLVSKKTKNYYTQDGLLEQIKKDNPDNQWYFKFKNQNKSHEINLDFNQNITKDMIMFINFKILDENFHFLGATGVGIQMSYVKKMLTKFKEKYKLKVMFLDTKGNIVLSQNHVYGEVENIKDTKEYQTIKNKILTADTTLLEYSFLGSEYILNTKYIKELDSYLLVEAKLDDFTKETKNTFYTNLTISLSLAFIIAIIIINIVRTANKKLEDLAQKDTLTDIPNRRDFTNKIQNYIALVRRSKKPLTLLFMDLDDFKHVNDTFGHDVGDIALKEFAHIIKSNTRESDIYARWGGEEFILAFIDTTTDDAQKVAHKIRTILENSLKLKTLLGKSVTMSAGITNFVETDTLDTFISRADKAMYEAKESGKNRIKKA